MRKTFKKDKLLKFLEEHAPKAPIRECMNLANEFQNSDNEEYENACVIAVLSSYFCGEHGEFIKERVPAEMTPILKWAFDKVVYRHGWVSCGPGGGMSEFLKEMEKCHLK